MYFGEEKDTLDGKISMSGWLVLTLSALIMILGVINLFGVEVMALNAAFELLN